MIGFNADRRRARNKGSVKRNTHGKNFPRRRDNRRRVLSDCEDGNCTEGGTGSGVPNDVSVGDDGVSGTAHHQRGEQGLGGAQGPAEPVPSGSRILTQVEIAELARARERIVANRVGSLDQMRPSPEISHFMNIPEQQLQPANVQHQPLMDIPSIPVDQSVMARRLHSVNEIGRNAARERINLVPGNFFFNLKYLRNYMVISDYYFNEHKYYMF